MSSDYWRILADARLLVRWSPLELEGHAERAPEGTPENLTCRICMANLKNVMMLPCKHVCCCLDCARQVEVPMTKCPICRRGVDKMMVVYL